MFCFLRFPSGLVGPPAPVVAGPAQGAPLHGRRLQPDGDVRRHGARGQADRSTTRASTRTSRTYGEYITRSGDIFSPRIPNSSRCGSSASTSSTASAPASGRARTAPAGCAWCACSSSSSTRWIARVRMPGSCPRSPPRAHVAPDAVVQPGAVVGPGAVIHDGAPDRRRRARSGRGTVVHAGTQVGDGCVIEDHVVLGKRPRLRAGLERRGRPSPSRSCSRAGSTVCCRRHRLRRRPDRRRARSSATSRRSASGARSVGPVGRGPGIHDRFRRHASAPGC